MLEFKTSPLSEAWDTHSLVESPVKFQPNPTPNLRMTFKSLSQQFKDSHKEFSPSQTLRSSPSDIGIKISRIPSKQSVNEEENIEFDSTDDHIQPIQNSTLGSPVGKEYLYCPHCLKRIDLALDKILQSIQSPTLNERISSRILDFQLSERIKTPYSPTKTNLVTGRGLDSPSLFEIEPLLNIQFNKELFELPKGGEINDVLYQLADQKAKYASVLGKNDEIIFELKKKQTELDNLEKIVFRKEDEIKNLQSENFLLKRDFQEYQEKIAQLNSSQMNLLKSFNRFAKYQTSFSSFV